MDPPTNDIEDPKGVDVAPTDPDSSTQSDERIEFGPLLQSSNPPTRQTRTQHHDGVHPRTRAKPYSQQQPRPRSHTALSLARDISEWLTAKLPQSITNRGSFAHYKIGILLLMFGAFSYILLDSYDLLHLTFNDDDTPSWSKLSWGLSRARRRIHMELESEYGNWTQVLFSNVTIAHAFRSNSLHILKRRMKIKIIQAGVLKHIVQKGEAGSVFTWVTGGDDSAAGYGNLLNQTYTKILENTVEESFKMVGIKFVAKNFAMGGTPSGPEVSLCMESLFGTDVDILSWDYEKADANHYDLYRLWGNRAGIHPTMPVIFLQGNDEQRAIINEDFENVGLCTVGSDVQYLRSLMPETVPGTLDELPPAVKYYKCSGKVEEGGLCDANKWWADSSCDMTKYQTKENSGWKDHRLIGRATGAFLIEMLAEALAELEYVPLSMDSIHNLTVDQDLDRLKFRSSAISQTHQQANLGKNTEFLGGQAKYSPFWRSSSLCHSAMLPNQARYNGAVTLGNRGFLHKDGYHTDYDVGYSIDSLPDPDDSTDMILVYLPQSRQNCSSVVRVDYKDFFLVRTEDKWAKTTIPNDVEMKQFRINNDKRGAHAIVLCGNISATDIKLHKIAIRVDGVDVIDIRSLSNEPSICHLLVGEHDSFLWVNKPGRGGQFQVELRLHDLPELRLSSIIII